MQYTAHLLMIRPAAFAFNEQTAANNAFQSEPTHGDVAATAVEEFDAFVAMLREHNIDVTVVDDAPEPHTPDAIFPNNWISFHENGLVFLYPMFAPNRRLERNPAVLNAVKKKFAIKQVVDLSGFEAQNKFLEGTGSMVFDRDNSIAYACLSPRMDITLLREFCGQANYSPVIFSALDDFGNEIYHTNVMMCIADKYAVICLDSIKDIREREFVANTIEGTGKKIVEISLEQMNRFAGNMLQVANRDGEIFLVMSRQAFEALTEEQVKRLQSFNAIITSNLSTIEANGGGSARCMIAEIHLPLLNLH